MIDGLSYEKNTFCYFDHAATTFMPDEVIRAMVDYNTKVGVSVNRGKNFLSSVADESYFKARNSIKEFFDLPKSNLIFYKSASYAINEIAYGLSHLINPMDIVLVGPYEHHSNYLPWRQLCIRNNAIMFEMPLDENNKIDTEYIKTIKERVKIIAFSSIANINGFTINVNEIKEVVDENTLIIVDDSQMCGHMKIDTSERIDCHIVNSHKMYGPKGIAGAIVNERFFQQLRPCIFGGGMVERVGFPNVWKTDESRFECGTQDVSLAIGWLKACEYINRIGYEKIKLKEKKYADRVLREIERKSDIIITSFPKSKSIISFFHNRIHAHDVEGIFSEHKIVVRGGNLCSQNSIAKYDMKPIVRISFGLGNSDKDIETLIDIIGRYL